MTLQQTHVPALHHHWDWRTFLQRFGPLVALILLVAFARWRSDRFLSAENILNVLGQNSFVGIVALGMTFVIILGGIDLSVGSLLALAGCVGLWTMNTVMSATDIVQRAIDDPTAYNADSAFRVWLAHGFTNLGMAGNEGYAIALAVLMILLVGTLGGLLNGLLVSRGRLAPFIATLGTMAAFRSLVVTMANAGQITPSAPGFTRIGRGGIAIPGIELRPGEPLQISYPILTLFALVIILWIVLRRTRYGRYVIAVGCNEKAAVYSAIRVKTVSLMTYTLLGLFVGIASLLQVSKFSSLTSGSTGSMMELDAIAAVAIGGTSMRGGSGTVLGTLVGVLLLGVIGNMLNMLNINPHLQGLVKGSIVIGAALLQRPRSDD
jgi:ribose transport system permease protein